MIKVTYSSPLARLKKIKVGDEIIDEYDSSGRVIRITENIKDDVIEFTFLLDNKQTIFIMSSLAHLA